MDLIEELMARRHYLTTKEVMKILRITRNTLCAWVRGGRIAAIRRGKGYLFDPKVLAMWLRTRESFAVARGEAQ